MMYLKWALLVPVALFFKYALAVPLSPLLAAWSVLAGINKLPWFFQWFSTIDDDLDGGQHQHPEIYPLGVTGFKLWWQRVCWICRNPAQGWEAHMLGFRHEGYRVISERSSGLPSFEMGNRIYSVVMEDAKGNRYFSYRRDLPVGKSHFIKMWFGWHYEAKDGVFHTLEFQPFGWRKK